MSSFRKLPEPDLAAMDDEALFQHFVRARAHREHDYARQVLRILTFGLWDKLVGYIAIKTPWEVAPEIADQALEDAYTAKFDGRSVEQFRALVFRIAKYRRADYYRKGRLDTTYFAEEHEGDEDFFSQDTGAEPDTGLVGVLELIAATGEPLSDPHKLVVVLCLIEGYDSDSAAKKVNSEFPELQPPMTSTNVDKINSRFRKALRTRLEDNETDPDG